MKKDPPKTPTTTKINKLLNDIEAFVTRGEISRTDLTKIILKRHILSAKLTLGYMLKNTGQLF